MSEMTFDESARKALPVYENDPSGDREGLDYELDIRMHPDAFGYALMLLGRGQARGVVRAVSRTLTMQEVTEEDRRSCRVRPEPFATLQQEGVQKLMDSLWMMGFRPTNHLGEKIAASTLEAQVEHVKIGRAHV